MSTRPKRRSRPIPLVQPGAAAHRRGDRLGVCAAASTPANGLDRPGRQAQTFHVVSARRQLTAVEGIVITPSEDEKARRIIEMLHHQHRYIEGMLIAFERQVAIFDGGRPPDYELIEQIIAVCIDYLGAYHRATEEPLLKMLSSSRSFDGAAIDRVEAEYAEVLAGARKVAEAIEAVLLDAEIPRRALSEIAREFLAVCRRHIKTEEQLLFPAATATLGSGDWGAIDRAISAKAGTRSSQKSEADYRTLYEGLVAWDRVDRLER